MEKGIELWMMIRGKEGDEGRSLDVRNGDGEEEWNVVRKGKGRKEGGKDISIMEGDMAERMIIGE